MIKITIFNNNKNDPYTWSYLEPKNYFQKTGISFIDFHFSNLT